MSVAPCTYCRVNPEDGRSLMDLYCILELPHEQAVKARVGWQIMDAYPAGVIATDSAIEIIPKLVIRIYFRKASGTKVSRSTPPKCHVLKRRGYVFLVRFEEAYGWALASQSPMLIAVTSRSYKEHKE